MIESVRTSTVRHSPIRPTPTRKAAAGIAVLASVLSACGLFGPDQPDTVSQQFADALNSDDVQAAAELTTDPVAATAAITAMYDGLGNKDGTFTRTDVQEAGDNGGTFTMDVSWPFAPGQEWKYSTTGNATKEGDDWKIVWDPAVLAPGLTDDTTVRYTTTTGAPPKVLAAGGAPILEQQVVTLVNLEPGADTAAVAALLSPIAPTITAASLQQDLAGAQGKPVTAISLRAEDLAPIEPQLRQLAGVTLAPQTRLLSTDKALASPTLAGLGDLWQEGQDASAGWAVQLVGQDGAAKSVAGEQGPDAPDIATTLDLPMQMAAERALADVPQQAAIVALRPSTGEVLAVAQNAPADALGPIALTGLYPPGSTFKTVTTSAALQAGAATPDTVLPCPGTENIEGRQIPNDDEFDLGAVPLHTAFARSCNTTMGRLAVGSAARRPAAGRAAVRARRRLRDARADDRDRQRARRRQSGGPRRVRDRAGAGDRDAVRDGHGGRLHRERFDAVAYDRARPTGNRRQDGAHRACERHLRPPDDDARNCDGRYRYCAAGHSGTARQNGDGRVGKWSSARLVRRNQGRPSICRIYSNR